MKLLKSLIIVSVLSVTACIERPRPPEAPQDIVISPNVVVHSGDGWSIALPHGWQSLPAPAPPEELRSVDHVFDASSRDDVGKGPMSVSIMKLSPLGEEDARETLRHISISAIENSDVNVIKSGHASFGDHAGSYVVFINEHDIAITYVAVATPKASYIIVCGGDGRSPHSSKVTAECNRIVMSFRPD